MQEGEELQDGENEMTKEITRVWLERKIKLHGEGVGEDSLEKEK